MLDLSNPQDRKKLEELISEDVNTFCAEYYEHGHRNHLGASELGEPCWRKLWYSFRWVKEEKFDGRMLRLFNVGHSAEPRFVSYLKGIGFEVKEFEKDIMYHNSKDDTYLYGTKQDGIDNPHYFEMDNLTLGYYFGLQKGIKPNQFRISGAMGHYGGSLDGLCKAPTRYQLSEDIILSLSFKTNKDGSDYEKVSKEALQKSKPKHWAQECQYGYKAGIKYCLYMIENKNNSDITFKIIELDWNYGAQLEKKANDIILAKEPPPRISENSATWDCKFCSFSDICHNGETPEKNCRSCRQARPVEDAKWFCCLHQSNIPDEWVKKGCYQWLPI